MTMKTSLLIIPALLLVTTSAFAYDEKECMKDFAGGKESAKVCAELQKPTDPVTCYVLASKIDEKIHVGGAVDLCAGSTDWKETLACYNVAWTELGLNRGQAVRLCGAGQKNRP